MKKYIILTFLVTGLIFINSCKDDDIETPTPSTNANFTYEMVWLDGSTVSVQFTNHSTEAEGYLWEFGINNETSTEENPVFIYDSIGVFTIKLTCTPKNDLYYNVLVDSATINTTPVIWEVNFDNGMMPTGETENDTTALFNLDQGIPSSGSIASLADSAWIVAYRSETENYHGGLAALGVSYYNPPAEADDWMIFPAIELPADKDSIDLSWLATSLTTSGNYPDHYEVGISTTTQDPEGCMENIIVSIEDEEIIWTKRKFSIAQFKGQKIYVGFHLNTPYDTGDRLAIDDIQISAY